MALDDALAARTVIRRALQTVRRIAANPSHGQPLVPELPPAVVLQKSFQSLESQQVSPISPVRRWAMYALVEGGFASALLSGRLREVNNSTNEPIGQMMFEWMATELERFNIKVTILESLPPIQARELVSRLVRLFLTAIGVTPCDPENLTLTACRRAIPGDSDYVTTINTSGDFPRSVAQMAVVLDPRNWDKTKNPYAIHFEKVEPVDAGGNPIIRPEPIGDTWDEPSYIYEKVSDDGGLTVESRLMIQFVVTSTWLRFTYEHDTAAGPSEPPGVNIEVNFGYIHVDPLAGKPGWTRFALEKNVRFSGNPGMSGGNIGWGDLPNALAPDLVADWLMDMRMIPCWEPAGS
jgi:hypothetical protein